MRSALRFHLKGGSIVTPAKKKNITLTGRAGKVSPIYRLVVPHDPPMLITLSIHTRLPEASHAISTCAWDVPYELITLLGVPRALHHKRQKTFLLQTSQ